MKYFCCDERRSEVAKNSGINGIDFLEVQDDQKTLFVHFINPLTSGALAKENIRIEGGERIQNISVDNAPIVMDDQANVPNILKVQVDKPGDFSTYTLRLVRNDAQDNQPPDGFDQILSAIDFSFKVDCHSDFDCLTKRICPPEPQPQPEINYLAKDFASFRQLMLDRMALLMPQWKERNPADVGNVLVELLAYVGDYLSYQQDSIATEAYLGTARRRISVRRHARLVDYFMHDGCNARALVQVHVKPDITLPKGTQLLTHVDGQPVCIPTDPSLYEQALAQSFEVFETMHTALLFQAHNELRFYAWGSLGCCLPIGATRATLQGRFPNLKAGDLLIFTEVLDPQTGDTGDANPDHRHAVRLINVVLSQDMLGGKFLPNPNNNPVDVTEIQWAPEDALPFPLCISATTDKEHGEVYNDNVSIALGNIVLADHGLTIKHEDLGEVPEPTLFIVSPQAGNRCQEQPAIQVPPRFNPPFKEKPLTFAVPFSNELPEPANKIMHYTPQDALPAITSLSSDLKGKTDNWTAQRDLLSSKPDATDFVVEVEADGTAYLRFGNYEPQNNNISSANVSQAHGLRPDYGTGFTATYRIGNGMSGNVGPEAIAHIVCDNQNINCNNQNIDKIRNPLPARGGVDPESIENVRQSAPSAFRIQERAVTEDDYAEVAERYPGVQRAAATFRWTGTWRTVFVTIDRPGGLPVDANFKNEMQDYIDRYRMAGYDIEVDGPVYVSLQIEMHVCVKSDYFRGDVEEALMQVFSNRVLPDGRKGVFDPDNFTFGQTVFLSPIYAAAQAVEGVSSVQITTFQRQGTDSDEALKAGKLILGRLEIARLDNDPNFPEHGVLSLIMEGGK
jgi:hypothetical protein